MDEATIDCTVCGRDAYLEVRVETLDDTANWRTTYRYLICPRHLNRLQVSYELLGTDARVILMRCG